MAAGELLLVAVLAQVIVGVLADRLQHPEPGLISCLLAPQQAVLQSEMMPSSVASGSAPVTSCAASSV